jgi:protein SCO1/2
MKMRIGQIKAMAVLAVASAACFSPALYAQKWTPAAGDNPTLPANVRPAQLVGVDVVEHLQKPLDLTLEFTGEDGYPVALSSFFHAGRPVILDLVYYNCPMLCTLVLNGQTEAMRGISWTPGTEYEVVTISIDPQETFADARKKKAVYMGSFDRPAPGWHFLADRNGSAKKLAEMIGYHYKYDPQIGQFAHPAAITLATPEGRVARYLYGVRYSSRDLRFALAEASEGRSTMALEKFLLFCYHYDPKAGRYVMFATNFMRAGGILTVLLISGFLIKMFRSEKGRTAARLKEGLA